MLSNEYIAGLFDGEGYFTMVRSPPGRCIKTVRPWRYQCCAAITLREEYLLKQVEKSLGYGTVRLAKKQTDKHCNYYKWTVSGNELQKFCEEVGPLMLLKKERAKLIVKVCKIKTRTGNKSTTDADYKAQEKLWEQLKALNMKGPNNGKNTV